MHTGPGGYHSQHKVASIVTTNNTQESIVSEILIHVNVTWSLPPVTQRSMFRYSTQTAQWVEETVMHTTEIWRSQSSAQALHTVITTRHYMLVSGPHLQNVTCTDGTQKQHWIYPAGDISPCGCFITEPICKTSFAQMVLKSSTEYILQGTSVHVVASKIPSVRVTS